MFNWISFIKPEIKLFDIFPVYNISINLMIGKGKSSD